ncbi:MAG: ferrous iron transport protein B [Candidatus Eisenbacteria bacterium]|nr:ferrous iron transport protein B [Candidatus Latescibacterota bacterium]MBD3302745.1 ferrous iron transport protein B [Candidatus Eisenbacteria bacterium]
MAERALRPEENQPEPILLVGNPNVGKSVLFGVLTGRYVQVSNYPGTTIEVTRGAVTGLPQETVLIDTPGTNHLIPMSEDERVTRDLLLEEPAGTIVQVGDAKNLRRTLALTLELALMGRSTVLALNMMDEARSRGVKIDTDRLAARLGVPVVETVAVRRQGIRGLRNRLANAARPNLSARYAAPIEQAIDALVPHLRGAPADPRFLAVLYLSGDRTVIPRLRSLVGDDAVERCEEIRLDLSRRFEGSLANAIQTSHLEAIDALLQECYVPSTTPRAGWRHRVGRWSTDPVRGIAVLALVLAATFWFVGLFGAGTMVDLLETGLFGQVLSPLAIEGVDAILPFPHTHAHEEVEVVLEVPLTPVHGIETGIDWSRTVTTPEYETTEPLTAVQEIFRFIHDLFVGPYGVFTMAIAYGFAIVLPIVATFFLLFSILEDTGYLPRLAVMVNDIFRMLGLNGRAVLPMVLGLGCDTMATLTTRILDTRKQRLIVTLLLALGVPCSAQLGVLLAMLTSVSFLDAILWLVVITGVMLSVGWLSSRVIRGPSSDFLLEIPPIRTPVLGNIVLKTLARIEWYLREVIPLFVLGTLLLFGLDRTGALPALERLASPLVQGWLGLPAQTTEAFLVGFLRRDYGAVFLLQAATGPDRILDSVQVLVSMVVITLFVPCIAHVFVIAKEHGAKIAAGMVLFIFPFAFLVGGVLLRVLRFAGIG